MAVVRLVRNTGCKLTRMLSMSASRLVRPSRISLSMVTRMWMLSATASVMIIVGALADGGVMPMPSQPASPIAVPTDNPMMTKVTAVPVTERSMSPITTRMARNMMGMSEVMSFCEASWKAMFSMAMPVM